MRWSAVLPIATVGAIIVFLALFEREWSWPLDQLGFDYHTYMDATSRWLAGGSFYAPFQLSGPYEIRDGSILYPPYSLVLFTPFTILPALLWWAVPLSVTAWAIWANRPSLLGWGLIGIAALTPRSVGLVAAGNPVIWVLAALAVATRFGWVSVGVLLKPTLAPFALFGVRDRRWRYALGALALVAVGFLPLWPDYITALQNARGLRAGFWYSIGDVSLMLVPLAAYLTRRRVQGESPHSESVARTTRERWRPWHMGRRA